jgi:hypothetical protein
MDQMAILPAAPPSRLGNEAVVTEDEPHPIARAGDHRRQA